MTYNPRTQEAYKLFHDGILALARAEEQGIRINMEYVTRKIRKLNREMEVLEEEFKESSLFKHWQHTTRGIVNIHSPIQLSHFLYKIKKIKVEKETISGQGSVDDEALQKSNIPELLTLLEIRKMKKIRDYLEIFEREQIRGYIHPFFNLHLVQTYRSSSDHPNFQNIPKRDEESMRIVRRALLPRPGHQLLEVDYSGLEVRIAACYHKDSTMLRYIKDPTSDMHTDMAKQIFKVNKFDKNIPEHYTLRQAAKNGFIFPEFYGDYYKNCAPNLVCNWGKLSQGKWKPGEGIPMPKGNLSDHLISKGLPSFNAFTEHLRKIEDDFWSNRFYEYAQWKDRWYTLYKKQGYVDLLTGFRCGGVMDKKQVINYPVQGAAFHCLLWSFVKMDEVIRKQGWDTRLVGQIHDAIILDINPKELPTIVQMMKRITCKDLVKAWPWIIVPMDIEMELCPIDGNWAEKKKYTIL